MAYKLQGFEDGKVLTAENLINIETAIMALEQQLPINYGTSYTNWDYKDGLEGSDIKDNSFSITNTKDTAGVFGIRYNINDLPFKVGDNIYIGIKDFQKDNGNFSLVFFGGSGEISRVNATVTQPITYIKTVIPEGTTRYEVRVHGSSWTQASGGKYYVSAIDFDENTVFQPYTGGNSTDSSTSTSSSYKEIYISPNGNDGNSGDYASPMKTITAALNKSNRVTLFGGTYPKERISVSYYPYSEIFIRGVETQRVIINCGDRILVDDGSETLVEGYTKVYQVSCPTCPYASGAFTYRIYQDWVPDATTYIEDKDRHALQRGREYRCDSTIIKQIYNSSSSPLFNDAKTGLDKIEALGENVYGFYWHDGVMYFSRPQVSSKSNPIILPIRDDRFIDQQMGRSKKNQCRVVLNNIEVRYANIHLSYASNNECSDVLVKYPYVSNGGGFYIYEASNCKLTRCETCSVTNGTSTGDGFNVDTKGDTNSDDNALCCSVIMDNCWSHDNNDDGYSDHDRSEVLIRGGLFEYCGKGGLTPAYGSNDVIENAICRYNRGAGILSTGEPTSPVTRKFTTINAVGCLCYGQETGFKTTSGCMIHAVNCIAYDNTKADFDAAVNSPIFVYGCLTGSEVTKTGPVQVVQGLKMVE